MVQSLQRLSQWLAKHASAFIIAVAVITFLLPGIFKWVHGNTQTVILGLIMLTMGLTLTTQDFKVVLQRPWDFLVGAVAQFVIMPGVAYLSGRRFEQYHVVSLSWRRGFLGGNDLCFNGSGACDDTSADAVDGGSDH